MGGIFDSLEKSALAELGSATSSLEAVLLTFFHTWVTCQVASCLKSRSVLSVCLKKRSCNAMSDSSGLSCVSAAVNVY